MADPREQARLATAREPHSAMAWIVLSEAELDAGDAAAGEHAARRALALAPGHPEALARLGRAQSMLGQPAEAVASLRAAADAAPKHPGFAVWLGHALEDAGEAEAASAAYARAHACAPGEPQLAAYLLAWRRKLCDWRDIGALSAQVRDGVRRGRAAIEPFAFLSEDGTAAEQRQCAELRAAQVAAAVPDMCRRGFSPDSLRNMPIGAEAPPTKAAAIRVGFLSNGFGAHPTGLLTVALLEALRTHRDIDVHLFALNADDGSAIRRRLYDAAAELHDVARQPHQAVAEHIRKTAIDVLFDLRGWGGGGTPEVLAMRPAPVQVNWLAFPGTSGAPWIDVVLADAFVLPAALEPHFSERVLRLPRCFQPSDTSRILPSPRSRTDYGLPESGVVYCCFNNSYKLNPRSVARALAVLAAVDDSVLWLLSGPGDADRRLHEVAAGAGIDPARLVFMAKQPQPEYLARLQLADLFLDTHPYNAHTTASDALWAGCPVLTCPGETFASRVAGSLNHHLGLHAMNVAGDDAFVARAVALGRDPGALRAVRADLQRARRTTGVFDMGGFADDFAAAIRLLTRRPSHAAPARQPAADLR